MAEDIIFSVPEACGEHDCPVGWHIAHYWIYDDGTYSVCDSDGNHDDVEESDLPSHEEQDRMWRDYSRHVIVTGTDPLNEFYVKRTVKRRERWTFQFRNSICGMLLVQAKRRGDWIRATEIPDYVREYADVTQAPGKSRLLVANWKKGDVKLTRHGHITQVIDRETPRDPAAVARDLKAAARRSLTVMSKRDAERFVATANS